MAVNLVGEECFCGNSLDATRKSTNTCDMHCTGAPTEVCGGGWLLSIFERDTTSPTTPLISGWKHSYCYSDDWDRTLTGISETSTVMTPSLCAKFCCGSKYFGMEAGNECFCGETLDQSKIAPLGECDMPCTGDNTLHCGGGWRLSIYEDNPDDGLSACSVTSSSISTTSTTTTTSRTTAGVVTTTTTSRSTESCAPSPPSCGLGMQTHTPCVITINWPYS